MNVPFAGMSLTLWLAVGDAPNVATRNIVARVLAEVSTVCATFSTDTELVGTCVETPAHAAQIGV